MATPAEIEQAIFAEVDRRAQLPTGAVLAFVVDVLQRVTTENDSRAQDQRAEIGLVLKWLRDEARARNLRGELLHLSASSLDQICVSELGRFSYNDATDPGA